MKTQIKILLTSALMLFTISIFATTQDVGTNPEPLTIIGWLTPFIVLVATWLFRKVAPKIPGWSTMIIISGLSAAVAWVTNISGLSDMSFLTQTLYGLLAVFINQMYRQFTGGNTANSIKNKTK